MSDVVIRAEGLGKKYTIGHQSEKERYYALRDVMARNVKNLWKGAKDLWSGNPVIQGAELEEFWALKDVSFEIKQGEAVGIIGRNGAGKSTLLKVLSRITEPSAGKVTIKGRVASLLEVGTGFHPELTGRENIFLNGAILGMSRKEIKSKFDEIVDFAEIEKFLDTPVKRYSSGMYVRLAFAVAAHLEPEILLVDEVLAVGDSEFQKKCLGKMEDVSKVGRTVVFVSHNMAMITSLCHRAILLDQGRTKFGGSVQKCVDTYFSNRAEMRASVILEDFTTERRGDQEFAKFISISVYDIKGHLSDTFAMGDTIIVRLQIDFKTSIINPGIGVMFRNVTGTLIHDFRSAFDGFFFDATPGVHDFEITVPQIRVYPGIYTLGAWIQRQIGIASDDYISAALKITIVDRAILGHPQSNFATISKEGSETYHPCKWRKHKE